MIEEAYFESEANANISVDGRIQLVARIGYTEKNINAVSVRRAVIEFETFE